MSNFWSLWIIVLTTITIIGVTWILLANRKTKGSGPNNTTGHIYDGIEEYDNPLPAWWLYLFLSTIVFSVLYLIAYPGMGRFKGLLDWTQVGQWEQQQEEAQQRYGAIFAQYRSMTVEELANDRKAFKMGRRLFANNCAQCHGSDARGTYGFPNLTDKAWLYGGDPDQIKTSITLGRVATMPAWKSILTEAQIANVAAYVVSLGGRQVDDEKVEAGEKHYQTLCAGCHGVAATGNIALGAPNLSDNSWLYGGSLGLVQRSIRYGRNGKMPAHGEVLGEDKIHLLTAYIYKLSNRESRQNDMASVTPVAITTENLDSQYSPKTLTSHSHSRVENSDDEEG